MIRTPADLPESLRSGPLLAGIVGDALEALLGAADVRHFGPGEVILCQGTVTHNVWLIVEGRAEVVKEPEAGRPGKPVRLAELGPGDTLGEMTLFDDEPHCTSVWSLTDLGALKLSRAALEQLEQRRPDVACRVVVNLVRILSARLRRMDEWLGRLLDEHDVVATEARWRNVRDRLQRTFLGVVR